MSTPAAGVTFGVKISRGTSRSPEGLAWITAVTVVGMAGGTVLGGQVVNGWGFRGGYACIAMLTAIPGLAALGGSAAQRRHRLTSE